MACCASSGVVRLLRPASTSRAAIPDGASPYFFIMLDMLPLLMALTPVRFTDDAASGGGEPHLEDLFDVSTPGGAPHLPDAAEEPGAGERGGC